MEEPSALIIQHEMGHIRQRHWIDIISELTLALQWANFYMDILQADQETTNIWPTKRY